MIGLRIAAFAGLIGWSAFAFGMVLAGRWDAVPLVVGGWVLLGLYALSRAFYWPTRAPRASRRSRRR